MLARTTVVATCLLVGCSCHGDSKKSPRPIVDDAGHAARAPIDAGPGLRGVSIHGRAPAGAIQLEIRDSVAWMANGEEVYRVPLDRSAGQVVPVSSGCRVVFDPPSIDVVGVADGQLSTRSLDGAATPLGRSPSLPAASGLFGHGDELVWGTLDDGIVAMARKGGKVRTVARKVKGVGPLAFAGDRVVFADGSALRSVPLKGGTSKKLADVAGRVDGLLVAGDRIVWRSGGMVASVAESGGEVRVHASGLSRPGWLAASASAVLWLDMTGDGSGAIRSQSLAGGDVTTLVEGPLSAGAATIDGGHVYFTADDHGNGYLLSLPLQR